MLESIKATVVWSVIWSGLLVFEAWGFRNVYWSIGHFLHLLSSSFYFGHFYIEGGLRSGLLISLCFMWSFQLASRKRAMLALCIPRFTAFTLWISLNSQLAKIASEDNPWISSSCTCWKTKSIDLFFLDNRSQIYSLTLVAVRYFQFAMVDTSHLFTSLNPMAFLGSKYCL